MKCNVCGQEFGNGAYCQHCNADRITALGNYSGGYNAPDSPKKVTSNPSAGRANPTSGYGSGNGSYNSSKRSGTGNSGEQFMVCYNCANVIPVDSEYCPCCRIKLYEVCPKCGHWYSSQYKICNKCGTDREEYLAEQRILEQRRQEEARRKEEEHKKILEEKRRRERQRLEEERRRAEEQQRQLEAKRREEKRQKEEAQRREAELISRIESSDAYKEAYEWLIGTFPIIQKKIDRIINIYSVILFALWIMTFITTIIIIAIGNEKWIFIPFIVVGCLWICAELRSSFKPYKYTVRLLEHYFSDNMFHNPLAKQAVKRYIEGPPKDNGDGVSYNGEFVEIFKDIMVNKKDN